MARQSEARRPLNFSPLICKEMCGMTSAPIKTRKGRGRGKQRVSCGITLARQWLIKSACCEDETNVVVYQSRGPSSSDRHGDQMRGVRHLYFLHSLNPSWCWKTSGPSCGGVGGASEAKWEKGGQRELSAQIVLSGSKQGTYWAVMYRGWKRLWSVERGEPATVLRIRARLHFQTLTPSKDIRTHTLTWTHIKHITSCS